MLYRCFSVIVSGCFNRTWSWARAEAETAMRERIIQSRISGVLALRSRLQLLATKAIDVTDHALRLVQGRAVASEVR